MKKNINRELLKDVEGDSDSELLLNGYKKYIFDNKKNLHNNTIEHYLSTAQNELTYRWEDHFGKSFQNFSFSQDSFKKLKEIAITSYKKKRSFAGLLAFNDYIDSLFNSDLSEETSHFSGSLNQILYGPPGTGKTFNSINKAIEIVDSEFFKENRTRNQISDHFKSLIYDEKHNPNGQIVFTTFHQSMAYEDFIEGIKPILEDDSEDSEEASEVYYQNKIEYIVKAGIFKEIVELAKKSKKNKIAFDDIWSSYIKTLQNLKEEKIFTSVTSELKLDNIDTNGNSIRVRFKKSWDPNESEGKRAFIVSKNMIERLFDAKVDGSETNKKGRTDASKYVGSGRATHIYSVYKDFYEYADSKGAFSQNERLNYVVIIDEINRGNVSSIFGELITLIEEDKRIGEVNELSAVLPYSGDKFNVPSNLFIIGTMNTADRSVEALDTALRRRFSFTEMPPLYDINEDNATLNYEFAGTIGREILRTINKRIEKLLDRDHLIGHSYFLIKKEEKPEAKLIDAFYSNIIPLLQEYFYGDYAKIGAVLGKGFILKEDVKGEVLFAEGFTEEDYSEKEIYQIIDYRPNQPNNQYVMNGMSFEKAIRSLMNQTLEVNSESEA